MLKEKTITTAPGWAMLFILLALLIGAGWVLVASLVGRNGTGLIGGVVGLVAALFLLPGLFVVNPNEAVALLLFGDYKGTARQGGLRYTNPFYTKMKISLKARNLNGERLKVNDLSGNPIEIAAVVVWRVQDTAEALFEVDHYESYVKIQSESAVRHLASAYPYDASDDMVSLRGATEDVSQHLQRELQERLGKAGVEVMEARLAHLAYAPEIAHAMLQRQQAAAVIAAREKIVEGAVSMVRSALQQLEDEHVVDMDEERKAAMVSNLLVVLCGSAQVAPVVNTGSLYT